MTANTSEKPTSLAEKISTTALVCVVTSVLIQATSSLKDAVWVASVGLVIYWGLEARRTGNIGKIILATACALTVAAISTLPQPLTVISHALAESSFVIGLFISLGLLREAADSSPLIQACGESIVKQPPRRRYLALTFGSHAIAIILNFGVMPLLGVMINKGNTLVAADNDPDLKAARQKSMMMAIFRGFALMTAWSPLSIVFAIAQSILLEVPWWQLMGLQFVITMVLILFGALLDTRHRPQSEALDQPETGTSSPLMWLALLIGAIVCVSILIAELLGARMVIGAMLTIPLSAWGWLIVQESHKGIDAPIAASKRLATRVSKSFPGSRNEVALIGGSMYTGIVGASMLPSDLVGDFLSSVGIPPVVLAIGMAWAMMILAQIGISQIITLAFFAGSIQVLAEMGLNPLVTVSGLMTAWALSICTTPVGAGVNIVSRLSDVPVQTIIREWNSMYVLGGALIVGVWMVLISFML
ncbi:hypothetical protein [Marinobacterium lutimaris]|uniref:Uncharacterized protein n=1 Tax=Marinobacterium lutimaris TaxID=568106 RepID=A0A1H6DSU4_9GAMM|nr:hypothetical protein [Marinobacterium lutimaris]SEG88290.1 hypothetical protein SAMN05444390_10955 [Marinobacterium lutimaris]